jgi:peroxiredoxin
MSSKVMFAALIAGFLSVSAAPAFAQDAGTKNKAAAKDESKTLKIGDAAPDFKLKDTEGKEHSLSELTKAGKIVVLQWFNPECPYVVKHYGDTGNTFNDMHTKYKDKNVVIFAINSNADGMPGSGEKTNAAAKKNWKMQYSILMDMDGTTGRAYNAKNTPAMYVIGKDGKLAYKGAIDDDNGADGPGKTNYVTRAVDQLLAGETVTTSETKPYGCSVKYSKK